MDRETAIKIIEKLNDYAIQHDKWEMGLPVDDKSVDEMVSIIISICDDDY